LTAQELLIETVMTKTVVTIDVATTVAQAARQLAAHLVSCVVVVEHGQPVGILTERDIAVCAAADHPLDAMSTGDMMGSPLVSVLSTDTLAHVIQHLAAQGIRHVPVLDRAGALVGLVTQSDLLRACAELAGILPRQP